MGEGRAEERGTGGIWAVTRGVEEIRRERAEEVERYARIMKGLAKCPVCKGEAKAEVFGAEGHGVWVGCDRSAECCRYIEIHTEGWSLEEVAAEWNRYNSRVYRRIRRMKRWIRKHLGADKRAADEERAKREAEAEEERAKREKVFGIRRGKRRSWWRGFWRKGSK